MNLDHQFQPIIFPSPEEALKGVVAVTDTLNLNLLYSAYLQGIFPWYNETEGEPVVWWSPDPRFVLFPQELHVPQRLRRFLRHTPYHYTMDQAFPQVIDACASVNRPDQEGTWIGPAMIETYCQLFHCGVAHSVEVWDGGELVGGLYGVKLGRVFFGESMFHLRSYASKAAVVFLVEQLRAQGVELLDCQQATPHLMRFGAEEIPRRRFLSLVRRLCAE